jgi:hypothetical protein
MNADRADRAQEMNDADGRVAEAEAAWKEADKMDAAAGDAAWEEMAEARAQRAAMA